MQRPSWFYAILAACAALLTITEVAYRVHHWNHWQLSTGDTGGVFNPATGVDCSGQYVSHGEELWTCFDLPHGRIVYQYKVSGVLFKTKPDSN